jgi:hypothetical protein
MDITAKNQHGTALVFLIIIIAVFTIVMLPVVAVFLGKMQLMKSAINREQAFQIAEAGINYYQWHLIYFPGDYQDDDNVVACESGFCHNYVDYDTQQTIGQFHLDITPPQQGQTSVIVQSTGWTSENPAAKRTITAVFGIPSLASHALLAHDWVYAWNTESYTGPVHSDSGIRFEGTTQSAVTSSVQTTYSDDCNQEYPENPGCVSQVTRDAIWALGPNKTQSMPYWTHPTTTADFTGISAAFSTIMAQSSLPENISLPPYSLGYSLVFNSNGTVSVYKILNKINSDAKFPYTGTLYQGKNTFLRYLTGGTDYASSICTKTNCSGCGSKGRCFQYTKTIPSSGLVIYSVNNLWVEGTVKGRVVVATANGASDIWSMPNIYIPNNIRYYDATQGPEGDTGPTGPDVDTIGLLAEGNIIVTKAAPNNTYIDAALLSQNGFVAFPICYSGGAAKSNIYFFGSIILHGSWWFNFTNYCGSYPVVSDGYTNPHFNWDSNLLYYPPPYFPASSVSAQIQMIKWTTN